MFFNRCERLLTGSMVGTSLSFSDARRACTVGIQSWLHKLCGRIHENSWDAHLCLTCARQWKTDELRINRNLPISSLDIYGYLGSSFITLRVLFRPRNSANQQELYDSSLSSDFFFCHCERCELEVLFNARLQGPVQEVLNWEVQPWNGMTRSRNMAPEE